MGTPAVDAYEILERIKDGFFALDEQWNFTYVNEEAARILFRSHDNVVGKSVWKEFPDAIHLPFYVQYHKAVMEQVPVVFDAYFPPLNTWFSVRAYPSPNGLSVYFNDITQIKQDAAEHEELFQLIAENSQDIISITSPEGRTEYVSPSIRTLLGYEPEEVIGSIRYDFWHPEDITEYRNSYHSYESILVRRVRHKNGHYVWIETTSKTKRDKDGKIVHAIGISRDITDRKAAEDELLKTKERLQSLIQHNADAIWVIDLEDRVLEINPAFETMFGWSSEEVIGKKLPIVPDDLKEYIQHIHQNVKTGISVGGLETTRQRRDGSLLDVSTTLSPIVDSKGTVTAITGICRDITERKKAQEMLQYTEKLSVAGQLAAGIAHEIRNPITAIKGFVQLMKSGLGNKEEYFDIMSSEIERIEEILSELLMLAKPQASKLEQSDMNLILTQVITLLETQANLKSVEMETDFPPGSLPIHCDENQLKQVFINYIKNAIEAMPTGGKLVIQIRQTNNEKIHIRFIDNGVGMSEEVLAKLGQPFYTTKEKGTGLGFMISKKIIENHFGGITITSEVNKGTTVEVTLPLNIGE